MYHNQFDRLFNIIVAPADMALIYPFFNKFLSLRCVYVEPKNASFSGCYTITDLFENRTIYVL